MNDSMVCVICTEVLIEGLLETPCGHIFHDICLLRWLECSKTCPHCRFSKPIIHRVYPVIRKSPDDPRLRLLRVELKAKRALVKRLDGELSTVKMMYRRQRRLTARERDFVTTLRREMTDLREAVKRERARADAAQLEVAEVKRNCNWPDMRFDGRATLQGLLLPNANVKDAERLIAGYSAPPTLVHFVVALRRALDDERRGRACLLVELQRAQRHLLITADRLRRYEPVLAPALLPAAPARPPAILPPFVVLRRQPELALAPAAQFQVPCRAVRKSARGRQRPVPAPQRRSLRLCHRRRDSSSSE